MLIVFIFKGVNSVGFSWYFRQARQGRGYLREDFQEIIMWLSNKVWEKIFEGRLPKDNNAEDFGEQDILIMNVVTCEHLRVTLLIWLNLIFKPFYFFCSIPFIGGRPESLQPSKVAIEFWQNYHFLLHFPNKWP